MVGYQIPDTQLNRNLDKTRWRHNQVRVGRPRMGPAGIDAMLPVTSIATIELQSMETHAVLVGWDVEASDQAIVFVSPHLAGNVETSPPWGRYWGQHSIPFK